MRRVVASIEADEVAAAARKDPADAGDADGGERIVVVDAVARGREAARRDDVDDREMPAPLRDAGNCNVHDEQDGDEDRRQQQSV